MSTSTFTRPDLPTTIPYGRHVIGSYPRYEQAQRVVDHLSDRGFPVQTVSIVGSDLRLVERITGRMTRGRAAMAGAASMAWLGFVFGLFVGVFSTGGLWLAVWGVLWGAVAGAIFGYAAHAATRGERDFSSTSGLAATTYDVLVEADRAPEAERIVGSMI